MTRIELNEIIFDLQELLSTCTLNIPNIQFDCWIDDIKYVVTVYENGASMYKDRFNIAKTVADFDLFRKEYNKNINKSKENANSK